MLPAKLGFLVKHAQIPGEQDFPKHIAISSGSIQKTPEVVLKGTSGISIGFLSIFYMKFTGS